ncbi:MAG: asparaginase [Pseudomonadota bacterium]
MDEHLVTLTRGAFDESRHRGHVAIWHYSSGLLAAWGEPHAIILPRSSCKMIQALPLVESGAAERAGLTVEHLALACASHSAEPVHIDLVTRWLSDLGFAEHDLRCGAQFPEAKETRETLIRSGCAADQRHNNCSGKHTGFLTLARDLGADLEYLALENPVQLAVRDAFEALTDMASPGYAIDGCSAPNFATSVAGLARAMAQFAAAQPGAYGREGAMAALYSAMVAHPNLVAGETRACTRIMRDCHGRAAVKTGAEGVFVAIVPRKGIGIAVKSSDGAARGSEAVIAQLLINLGALPEAAPSAQHYTQGPITNRRGMNVGAIRVNGSIRDWRL